MNECDDSLWNDPMVKEALRDGRPPSDIMLLPCPDCGRFGYYNEGSHFTCRFCEITYYVAADDEDLSQIASRCVDVCEIRTLADCGR